MSRLDSVKIMLPKVPQRMPISYSKCHCEQATVKASISENAAAGESDGGGVNHSPRLAREGILLMLRKCTLI